MTRIERFVGLALVLAGVTSAMGQSSGTPAPERPSGVVYVSPASVPTITPAVRDLPDWVADPALFGLEMKRRDDHGFVPIPYSVDPKLDPLVQRELERPLSRAPQTDGFGTLIADYAGQSSGVSPPDTNGDVGPNHFVQGINQSTSTMQVISKSNGAVLKTFVLDSLTSATPCRDGFCDSVVVYDRAADRWILSELPSGGGNVCIYVSTSGDPTGTYYAYTFAVESGLTDFPKYGVWPQNGNAGSYLMGANAGSSGRDVFAFDRAKMLQGLPATFQKFTVPNLPNSGFQLVLPATMQGNITPPNGEPAIFIRPHDDEAQEGASTPSADYLDIWALTIDWATPGNSSLSKLPNIPMADYDMSLCGLGGDWSCMPQPGTAQRIDPIREPIHFPLVYRNHGNRQAIVGAYVADADGNDKAAVRWFELRKTGSGGWTMYQEGVVGGDDAQHRAVASASIDGQGNIAVAYTRTGANPPFYPSLYYKGRLATDPLGAMTQGEHRIVDATSSKTGNERWGDYSGIGIDPADDCTFWFTSLYGGGGATRVVSFKFDQCGCANAPAPPNPSASAPSDNRIDIVWNDAAVAETMQYLVLRATTPGGPYESIGAVNDSSPGVGGGAPYLFHDDGVSGGSTYYYVIKAIDQVPCTSAPSAEASATATGRCRLSPLFGGLVSVTNPGLSTCTNQLSWSPATARCGGAVTYNVYRSTSTAFTPSAAHRIAAGVSGTSFADNTAIADRVAYFYVVRATEAVSALEETNTVERSATPTGTIQPESWTDTFEGSQSGGGFDRSGWSKSALVGSVNWSWSTARRNDGTHSWFAAGSATAGDKVLVSPTIGVGQATTVSFFHTYQFQGATLACPDGATLELSTDNGANWSVVPDSAFLAGGFTGTVSAVSNPLVGKRAWCTGTLGTMTQVRVDLASIPSLLNRTVKLRWRSGDDPAVASAGWYVDSVNVANAQLVGTCSTGTACVVPGAPTLLNAAGDCTGVTLTWGPGSGTASGYNVYRGPTPGGPYAKVAGMPVTGTSFRDSSLPAGTPYHYVISGACDALGLVESPASNELAAQAGQTPGSASGAAFASKTAFGWLATPGASGYDVVRGSLSALLPGGDFTAATTTCEANDLSATSITLSHLPAVGDADWYLVRGISGCGAGSYDDPSQTGDRDAEIAAASGACP